MVTCFDVCEILEMLSEASVKVFLDGGWGIDAIWLTCKVPCLSYPKIL